VSLTGTLIGGGGAVAAQHRGGLPAGQAHEVGALAALRLPGVGEGVAELVCVEVGDADELDRFNIHPSMRLRIDHYLERRDKPYIG
jgi:hypothetical protein